MKKVIKYILLSALMLLGGGIVFLLLKTPPLEGDWQDRYAVLPRVEFDLPEVTVRNMRDTIYDADKTPILQYRDQTYNLENIDGVDFGISYFGGDLIAHTFLVFRFTDSDPLVVSVEARQTKDQTYSPYLGLIRAYTVAYVLATERDVIGVRTHIREGERVYLYEGQTTPEKAQALLVSLLRKTEQLATQPEFYNTLTSNCTNILVRHIKEVTDRHIPWSHKIYLSGLSDAFAYEVGFLDTSVPFEELKEQSFIDASNFSLDDPDFSHKIRKKEF